MSDVYPRAPIIEAVIEFKTAPMPLDLAGKTRDKLRTRFAKVEDLLEIKITSELGTNLAPQVQRIPIGYRLMTDDATGVTSVQVHGLSISRLAPYLGWGPFSEDVAEQWRIWWKAAKRPNLTRLGMRFMNRIDIPESSGASHLNSDYVTVSAALGIPFEGPRQFMGIHVLARAKDEDIGARVQVSDVDSPLIGHSAVSIDIDVFCEANVPQSEDGIWAVLNRLRIVKNEIFESAITDRARELFR